MIRLLSLAFAATILLAACDGSGDPDPTPGSDTPLPTASAESGALPLRPDGPVLYAVAPDGSGLRVLFDEGAFYGYLLSPDGATIALTVREDNEIALYFLDVATGDREEVLRRHWLNVGSWSPDGRWLSVDLMEDEAAARQSLLYEAATGELLGLPPGVGYRRVWSPESDVLYVDMQGATVSALARVDVPSMTVRPLDVEFDDVALSPDGETIAVGRYVREGEFELPHDPPGYLIDLYDTEGARTKRLLELDDTTFVSGGLAWSPDGGRLAYSWAQFQDGPSFKSGIYAIDVETTEITYVTDAPDGVDVSAAWSADGSHLLVHRHVCTQCDGAGSKQVLARADGSGEIGLRGISGFEITDAAWALDGERFAYSGDSLYVARPGDTTSTVLASETSAAYSSISWAPDGSELYFLQTVQLQATVYAAETDGTSLESLAGDWVPSPDRYFAAGLDPDTGELILSAQQGRAGHLRHEALEGVQPSTSEFLWSPDSAWLAVFAGSKGGARVLLYHNGNISLVDTPSRLGAIRWSPDATRFAYATTEGIHAVDPETGESELVVAGGAYQAFDWSPDGSEIVIVRGTTVTVVSVDSAESRPLAEVEPRLSVGALRWSPDGAHIAIGDFGSLLVLSVETGEVRHTMTGVTSGFAWSLDGGTLAFAMANSQTADLPPGVHLLDAASGDTVQLTEATGRAHEVRGWLDDGRLLFASVFQL